MAKRKKSKAAKKPKTKVARKAVPAKRGKKRKVAAKKPVKRKAKKKVVKRKPPTKERAKTVEELVMLLKAQLATQSAGAPTTPLPISLLESLYKPTKRATILAALSMLAGQGLVANVSETEFTVIANTGVPLAPS